MKKITLRKFDFIFGSILSIASVFYLVECVKLFFDPFGRGWDKIGVEKRLELLSKWEESPALLPFIVGGLVLASSIYLVINAYREGVRFQSFSKDFFSSLLQSYELKVFFTIITTLALYIFALIPLFRRYLDVFRGFQGFPFMLATGLFVFLNCLFFNNNRTKKNLIVYLFFSASSAFVITFVFNKIALIPMP